MNSRGLRARACLLLIGTTQFFAVISVTISANADRHVDKKISHVSRGARRFIIGTRPRMLRIRQRRTQRRGARKCIAVCNGNGRHASSGYFDLENRPSPPEITRVRGTFVTVADNDWRYLSRSTTRAMAAYRSLGEARPSVK